MAAPERQWLLKSTASFSSFPVIFRLTFLGIFCPRLPSATLRMNRQHLHRDAQGRFISSAQPRQQPPATPATASTTRTTQFQRVVATAVSPFHSGVPISEAVAHTAAIFWKSPSDTPTEVPTELDSLAPSPTRYVPPPRYVTDPPVLRTDPNVSGVTGDASLAQQQLTLALNEDEVFFANNEQPQR